MIFSENRFPLFRIMLYSDRRALRRDAARRQDEHQNSLNTYPTGRLILRPVSFPRPVLSGHVYSASKHPLSAENPA
jgi:hypothetical protein